MTDSISRRTALVGGLSGAGIVALAACSSGGGGVGATDTSDAADATDATSAPADPGGSTGGSSGLAALDSIPVGGAVSAKLDGKPVLVSRPTSGAAACFSAICTHEGCTVVPAGKQLQCPCHGSVFDAATGAVISGPAPRALDKIAVAVDGGEVVPAG